MSKSIAVQLVLAITLFALGGSQAQTNCSTSASGLTFDGHALLNPAGSSNAYPSLNLCGCGSNGVSAASLPSSLSGKPSGAEVINFIQTLNDATIWEVEATIPLTGNAYHPQGMVILNDNIYITTVNVINRANGTGEGYISRYAFNGTLLDRVQVGGRAQLPAYHAGGPDTDGTYLYVPLAEYHSGATCGAVPNCTLPGTFYLYRVTPDFKEVKQLFSFNDHVGGLTLGGCGDNTYIDGNTWGSRTFYRWSLPDGKLLNKVANQNFMFEYQDCKSLTGCNVQLCSGIKNFVYQRRRDGLIGDQTVGVVGNTTGPLAFQLGGLALVDPTTGVAITEIPVPAISTPLGNGLSINPMWITNSWNGTTGFRILFAPDDVRGSVVVVRPHA